MSSPQRAGFGADIMSQGIYPYVAMGFVTQETPGVGLLCGLYALCGSLRAARELVEFEPEEITFDDLDAIHRSKEFELEVWRRVDYRGEGTSADDWVYWDRAEPDDDEDQSTSKLTMAYDDSKTWLAENFLDSNAIDVVLQIVNRRLGTFYRLGAIRATPEGTMVPASCDIITPDAGQAEHHRPVVYIHYINNNHWEAFSPHAQPIPNSRGSRFPLRTPDWLEDWDLDERISKFSNNGMYMLKEDFRDERTGLVTAYRGTFVYEEAGRQRQGFKRALLASDIYGQSQGFPAHILTRVLPTHTKLSPVEWQLPSTDITSTYRAADLNWQQDEIREKNTTEAARDPRGEDLAMYLVGEKLKITSSRQLEARVGDYVRGVADGGMQNNRLCREKEKHFGLLPTIALIHVRNPWEITSKVVRLEDPDRTYPVRTEDDIDLFMENYLVQGGEVGDDEEEGEDEKGLEVYRSRLLQLLNDNDLTSEALVMYELNEKGKGVDGLEVKTVLRPIEVVGSRLMRLTTIDGQRFVLPMQWLRRLENGGQWSIHLPIQNFAEVFKPLTWSDNQEVTSYMRKPKQTRKEIPEPTLPVPLSTSSQISQLSSLSLEYSSEQSPPVVSAGTPVVPAQSGSRASVRDSPVVTNTSVPPSPGSRTSARSSPMVTNTSVPPSPGTRASARRSPVVATTSVPPSPNMTQDTPENIQLQSWLRNEEERRWLEVIAHDLGRPLTDRSTMLDFLQPLFAEDIPTLRNELSPFRGRTWEQEVATLKRLGVRQLRMCPEMQRHPKQTQGPTGDDLDNLELLVRKHMARKAYAVFTWRTLPQSYRDLVRQRVDKTTLTHGISTTRWLTQSTQTRSENPVVFQHQNPPQEPPSAASNRYKRPYKQMPVLRTGRVLAPINRNAGSPASTGSRGLKRRREDDNDN